MTEQQLREEFEAWLSSKPVRPDLRRNHAGLYRNLAVESRWKGWLGYHEHFVKQVV